MNPDITGTVFAADLKGSFASAVLTANATDPLFELQQHMSQFLPSIYNL